ncbi:MAG: acyl carrier protein [Proteobacteria bacterium]|nr:acyl carrier protein [Pseudomonadota bacterium]MCL2309149.1 acyl carrier protein [Pseudomonadota bacterium]
MSSTMSKEEILDWMRKVLQEQFEIPAARVTREANLYQDLDIDSIDAVDLLIKLKQLTGKPISPEVFKQVRTVGDVVDAVHAHLQES